ncbi:MAG TPA: NAD(P)H-dependent oxidoreductase [Micropruina sp.]|jgi:NAD(P)H-dependent FMN reductase|nr:NAD(P)H-dependent oxidoreductase [Micropruina sp.]
MNVLTLVGSGRRGSFNARLADAAVAALPAGTVETRFDLTALPFYDADRDEEGTLGASVQALRSAVAAADAIVVASPAYNGALAAEVKNAIDTASRPRGNAVIVGKPAAVLTAPFRAEAGARVIEQITMSLQIAGAQPVGAVNAPFLESFDAEGAVTPQVRTAIEALVSELVQTAEQESVAA